MKSLRKAVVCKCVRNAYKCLCESISQITSKYVRLMLNVWDFESSELAFQEYASIWI